MGRSPACAWSVLYKAPRESRGGRRGRRSARRSARGRRAPAAGRRQDLADRPLQGRGSSPCSASACGPEAEKSVQPLAPAAPRGARRVAELDGGLEQGELVDPGRKGPAFEVVSRRSTLISACRPPRGDVVESSSRWGGAARPRTGCPEEEVGAAIAAFRRPSEVRSNRESPGRRKLGNVTSRRYGFQRERHELGNRLGMLHDSNTSASAIPRACRWMRS